MALGTTPAGNAIDAAVVWTENSELSLKPIAVWTGLVLSGNPRTLDSRIILRRGTDWNLPLVSGTLRLPTT
jgi:hypothetical protein